MKEQLRGSILPTRGERRRKYQTDNLMPALRIFAKAREQALKGDFTDNAGAIHSVMRIIHLLQLRLCFPHLSHAKDFKAEPLEISNAAHRARQRGEPTRIEHVLPERAFARQVCNLIRDGATDKKVLDHIARSHRLVIVTPEEAAAIDRSNRTRIAPDRLAGIALRRRQA
jgi:hypothetical protein